jgi:catechol-2,3-dioxygenase
VKEGVAKLDPRTHGNAWSIYFADPEGNRVELYCSSPWYVGQPFGESFDPTEPAEVIRSKTEVMVKQDPTWQPMDVWVTDMKAKLEKQTVPA